MVSPNPGALDESALEIDDEHINDRALSLDDLSQRKVHMPHIGALHLFRQAARGR